MYGPEPDCCTSDQEYDMETSVGITYSSCSVLCLNAFEGGSANGLENRDFWRSSIGNR